MKKNIVFLLILIPIIWISCDGMGHQTIDFRKIENLMPQHPDSALMLLEQIENKENLSRKDKAHYYLLLTEAQDKTFVKYETDSLITIATDYYEETDDLERKAKAWYYRGRISQDQNHPLKAQECYLKALRDEESIKDHALLGRVNNYIGILYTFQEVYEKALSFQKKAVSNFRAINDSIGQAYASRDLGRVYQMLALPDSAIACYLDAIALIRSFDEWSIYSELGNLYIEKKDYSLANQYLMKMKSFLDRMQANNFSDNIDFSFHATLGDYYNQVNKLDSALFYLNICKEQTTRLDTRISAYATLKKIAYKQNDWKQYVLLDQKYTSMHDSLHAQGEMESIRKYQALYDHQETELKLTKEQAKNAVSNLRIIIVMIVCFLVISLSTYAYFKHKQEKSQLILRQQEKDIQNKERLSIYENQIHDYEEQIALNEQTLHSLKEHLQDQNLKIESLNTMRTHLENEIQSLKHKKHIQENRAEEIAFKNSSLYAQFHDKKNWTPAPEDWQALLDKIDLIYPTLASTLSKTLPGSTISEKRLCYLLKIQVKPTVIARLLCCSDTNITMLRKRLYKKAFNKDVPAKEFDRYILDI